MDAKQRRAEILKLLQMDIKPMSANNIAEHFGVSRQIIVGDIALLRAAGEDILATQSGYILNKREESGEDADADTYILACRHDKGLLEAELYTIVDNGGTLVNVSVDHPMYGTITQTLEIRSRYDADAFLSKIAVTGASLLASLTDGAHLHTIRCTNPDAYRRILAGLRELGILYTK
ncbi:transcription repressor NadR [Ruminococcaceae bacterium OttesenSCG-928-O06]|nr:transcription repressor NadR [Ruminococcaceae bacterium OttesenSCG-928-O06]